MDILLVNSTDNAKAAVKKSLEKMKMNLMFIEGIEKTLDLIKKEHPQVVLINWGKKDSFDMIALCKKIRRLKLSKYVYIILMISKERIAEVQGLINSGADDFLLRPFGEEELRVRVNKAKKTIIVEDKLLKSKKNLMKLAKEDPLTNLLNRRSLLDEALKEMGRSTRENKYLSSILIRINNFQDIVDERGGIAGRALLLEASNRVRLSCRPYDKVGRYSVSDFLIILPDTGIKNAKKVAGRVLDSLNEEFLVNREVLELNTSIGISEIDPDDVNLVKEKHSDDLLMDDLLLDSLIKRSETAVEKARERGNNLFEVITD